MFNKIITNLDNTELQKKDIVLSLSGGLDSSTLYYNLAKDYISYKILPVFFDYGQRHLKQELKSARKITNYIQSKFPIAPYELHIVKINFNFLKNSSLINTKLDINNGDNNTLPNSFVPGRNLLFLTYLASIGYEFCKDTIYIALANHRDDFNGYPDCRMNTLKSLQKTLKYGLDKEVKIVAPFTNYSKSYIAKHSCDYILKNSWSCYKGEKLPCNTCKSCELRNEAINNLGDK